jgi:protein O-mannosyl-transferase
MKRSVHPASYAPVAAAIGLILLTFAAYCPAIQCGFIWDDDSYVEANSQLRSLSGLGNIWFDIDATPQYYPLVHTSYWIEYHLWGLRPAGYHIINILLHAVSAVLLWRILRLLGVPGSWLAAAVFGLHPIEVESVAWITERKNVLSGLFYLASLLIYLKWALSDTVPGSSHFAKGIGGYCLSLLLFACALGSKTVTATLPAALLLILWWKRKPLRLRHILSLIPFFVIGAGLGLLTAWLETHHVGARGMDWNLTFLERFLLAGRATCFYAMKVLWPNPLIFFYPRWTIDAHSVWQYLFPAAVMVVLITFWLARNKIGKGPFVAVGFFLVSLFPALGFFNVYPMKYSWVADHFQYLAGAGLIALVIGAGFGFFTRYRHQYRNFGIVLAMLVIGALAVLIWKRCDVYQNHEKLWLDTIEKNQSAWMAWNNLGLVYAKEGRTADAIKCYRKSIDLKADHVESYNNWAAILREQGRLDEAEAMYKKIIDIKPDYAVAYSNLGSLYGARGDIELSIQYQKKAIELKPRLIPAHYNLAYAYRVRKEFDLARQHFEKAVQLNPNYADAWYYLGLTCRDCDDPDAARTCISRLQSLNPQLAENLRRKFQSASDTSTPSASGEMAPPP